MTAPPPAAKSLAPVAFVLWRRRPRERWTRVAAAPTRRELLDEMRGSADYMILPVGDARFAMPTARK